MTHIKTQHGENPEESPELGRPGATPAQGRLWEKGSAEEAAPCQQPTHASPVWLLGER